MSKFVEISGKIDKITYSSGDYYILKVFSSKSKRSITVKGDFFPAYSLVEGLQIRAQGKMTNHPKWGEQIDVQMWSPLSNSVDHVLRYLVGGVPEVDIVAASKVEGNLLDDPNFLEGVVSEGSLERIRDFVGSLAAAHEVISLLGSSAITSAQIRGLFRAFGTELQQILRENPYRLLEPGALSFGTVDRLAQSLGFQPDSPYRSEGLVLWVLKDALSSGHLCLRRGDLATEASRLIEGKEDIPPFPGSLSDVLNSASIRLESRGVVKIDPDVGVYLSKYYTMERESARILSTFLGPSPISVDLGQFISGYQEAHGIELSDAQKAAILKLLESRVVVVTGQPGTGKTSVTRAFVALFEQAGLSFTLMAPTGIAAKRLSAATGQPAGTIHRTLGYQGDSWQYGADNKYSSDAVIVDEASMSDQEVFYQVLQSLSEGTILVIVGDDAQLPSVGPGNVLRELIASGKVPVVRLTQIFRQAAQSKIITNAHAINKGLSIDPGDDKSDFRFVPVPPDKMVDLIVRMAEKLKSRDANFQVIAPKYDGVVGVNALNEALRNTLNPPAEAKRELKVGSLTFREGDRVIITKNDYKTGVYNGDTGKITDIERDSVVVRVYSGGYGVDRLIQFKRAEFGEKVKLAYAITVHRSQGSEYGTVILPFVAEQGRMLQRNLIYTAVTRAREKVWVLGEMAAVRKAIGNDKVVFRGTGLAKALSEEVQRATGK